MNDPGFCKVSFLELSRTFYTLAQSSMQREKAVEKSKVDSLGRAGVKELEKIVIYLFDFCTAPSGSYRFHSGQCTGKTKEKSYIYFWCSLSLCIDLKAG